MAKNSKSGKPDKKLSAKRRGVKDLSLGASQAKAVKGGVAAKVAIKF